MTTEYVRGHYSVKKLTTPHETRTLTLLLRFVAVQKDWQLPLILNRIEKRATHWTLYHGIRLLGGCALVIDSQEGLPFEEVWPHASQLKGQHAAEIFYLIIEPIPHLSHSAFLMLCVEMFRHCMRECIEQVFTCITASSQKRYVRLGAPFEAVSDERLHWGIPSRLFVTSPAAARQCAATKSRRYQKGIFDQLDR